MASSENVEIVRRGFQAMESGDLEASAALVHEDFEMSHLPGWLEDATYRGLDEATRMMMEWGSSFDEFRWLPEQFTAAGADRVVVTFHEWGKPRGGSVEIEHLYGILITLREGKLARWDWFDSPEEALSAATERSDDRGDAPGT